MHLGSKGTQPHINMYPFSPKLSSIQTEKRPPWPDWTHVSSLAVQGSRHEICLKAIKDSWQPGTPGMFWLSRYSVLCWLEIWNVCVDFRYRTLLPSNRQKFLKKFWVISYLIREAASCSVAIDSDHSESKSSRSSDLEKPSHENWLDGETQRQLVFTTYREAEDQSHCLGSKRGRATTPHCPPQGQAREWSAGPLQIWGPRKRWPSWVCWSLIPSWDHTCLPSFLGFPQHGQGTHPKSIENTASLRWCHLTLIAIFSTLKSSFLQARKHRFKEVTPKVIKRISETKTRLSHFRVRALDLCARLPPKNQLQLVFV